tara:strand:- start:506 stop:709 length:204 start_codon:yes stop_codon:yes gene_type:complete
VVEETDTDLTTVMETILLDLVIGVAHKHHLMDKETMHTNIKAIVHGDQVVMEHSMVVEVLEDVKESW